MASNPIHGRVGVLNFSTSSGSTAYGTELGYTNSWSFSPDKDLTELTPLNRNSKDYLEGLVGGSFSAQGSLRIGDTIAHNLIKRFAKTEINDTDSSSRTSIVDGTLYAHCIIRGVDTAGSSDAARGAKFVVPILLSGLSMDMSGSDVGTWNADGSIDGTVLYVESTDTGRGFPTVG